MRLTYFIVIYLLLTCSFFTSFAETDECLLSILRKTTTSAHVNETFTRKIETISRFSRRKNINKDPMVQSLIKSISTKNGPFYYGKMVTGNIEVENGVLFLEIQGVDTIKIKKWWEHIIRLRQRAMGMDFDYAKILVGIMKGIEKRIIKDKKINFIQIKGYSVVNSDIQRDLKKMGFIEKYESRRTNFYLKFPVQ